MGASISTGCIQEQLCAQKTKHARRNTSTKRQDGHQLWMRAVRKANVPFADTQNKTFEFSIQKWFGWFLTEFCPDRVSFLQQKSTTNSLWDQASFWIETLDHPGPSLFCRVARSALSDPKQPSFCKQTLCFVSNARRKIQDDFCGDPRGER